MPRQNRARTIASEANLAARIARERGERGLSYESLAKAMADVGCPIDKSALHRIEKGRPPRKVSVDELVALSRVFQTAIDELLLPPDLIDQRRALELVKHFERLHD